MALATLAGASARAQEPPPAPERLAVEAFLWNTSSVAFGTGLVLGGGLELHYSLQSHGLYLGARLAAGSTDESTAEWNLTHVHMLASVVGGIEGRFGAGLLQAQLQVGALCLRQIGKRQQYGRLQADLVPGLERDGWSVGPVASLELGAAVIFVDPWRLYVQLGPGITVQNVNGKRDAHFFFTSSVGVGRAF